MTILTNNDAEGRMVRTREETINVAEAKKQLSTLLGRVAFGKETILIMRRGRPMARLIPPDEEPVEPGLGTVRGWLSDDDPFLAAVEEIVTARVSHRPRVTLPRPRASRKR
jgi:prevent-host-death family protein